MPSKMVDLDAILICFGKMSMWKVRHGQFIWLTWTRRRSNSNRKGVHLQLTPWRLLSASSLRAESTSFLKTPGNHSPEALTWELWDASTTHHRTLNRIFRQAQGPWLSFLAWSTFERIKSGLSYITMCTLTDVCGRPMPHLRSSPFTIKDWV